MRDSRSAEEPSPLKEVGIIEYGEERLKVCLRALAVGEDLAVFIYNREAHVGAVALADTDPSSGRAYASLLTAPGHREDDLVREAAMTLSRGLRRRACVIAGIHVDDITAEETDAILENCRRVVGLLIRKIKDE